MKTEHRKSFDNNHERSKKTRSTSRTRKLLSGELLTPTRACTKCTHKLTHETNFMFLRIRFKFVCLPAVPPTGGVSPLRRRSECVHTACLLLNFNHNSLIWRKRNGAIPKDNTIDFLTPSFNYSLGLKHNWRYCTQSRY